jgi:hypothetical protein
MSKRASFCFNSIHNPLHIISVSCCTEVLVVTSCGTVGAVYTRSTMKAGSHATNSEHTISLPQEGSTLKQRIAGIVGNLGERSGFPSSIKLYY